MGMAKEHKKATPQKASATANAAMKPTMEELRFAGVEDVLNGMKH